MFLKLLMIDISCDVGKELHLFYASMLHLLTFDRGPRKTDKMSWPKMDSSAYHTRSYETMNCPICLSLCLFPSTLTRLWLPVESFGQNYQICVIFGYIVWASDTCGQNCTNMPMWESLHYDAAENPFENYKISSQL